MRSPRSHPNSLRVPTTGRPSTKSGNLALAPNGPTRHVPTRKRLLDLSWPPIWTKASDLSSLTATTRHYMLREHVRHAASHSRPIWTHVRDAVVRLSYLHLRNTYNRVLTITSLVTMVDRTEATPGILDVPAHSRAAEIKSPDASVTTTARTRPQTTHVATIDAAQGMSTGKTRTNSRTRRRRHLRHPSHYNDPAYSLLINDAAISLTPAHIAALERGPSFIPRHKPNLSLIHSDLETFRRTLNLRLFWDKPSDALPSRSAIAKLLPSNWQPPQRLQTLDSDWSALLDTISGTGSSVDNPNISRDALSAWRELCTHDDFFLIPADKGGSLVTWKKSDYRAEANRQLNDTTVYSPITLPNLQTILQSLNTTKNSLLKSLKNNGNISNSEYRRAINTKSELPCIYFLPKVHKNKRSDTGTFTGRPIIAQVKGPLRILDRYLALITAPLLHRIPGSLIDTTALLNDMNALTDLRVDDILFSADVEALYPNIPWTEGLHATTNFYTSQLAFLQAFNLSSNSLPPPSPALFHDILNTIIKHNYFHFQNTLYFHQCSGTAMGCSMSVLLANCFMYHRTRRLVHHPPPALIYLGRYIDDIVGIWRGPKPDIPELFSETTTGTIRLSYVFGDPTLAALDVLLSISEDGRIRSTLYRKQSDNHQFVHWASAHPPHLKRSIPFAQLLRLRRICSEDSDFHKETELLLSRFKHRKYPPHLLASALQLASRIDRKTLLTRRQHHRREDRIAFITTYTDRSTHNITRAVRLFYTKWQARTSRSMAHQQLPSAPPLTCLRVGSNLGSSMGAAFKRNNATANN